MPESLQPLPLVEMPAALARSVEYVFCDIDDTLTLNGRLPAIAYAGMEALANAGIKVIPVTGRPAGWCDMIARFWPVAGVIGENGAFYFRFDHDRREMRRVHARTEAQRREDEGRLARIAAEVLANVPGCAIAADQGFRLCDLAIDFAEDVGPLDDEAIAAICETFERHGATAKVSSIHVNGWYGDHDKRTMCERFVMAELGLTFAEAVRRSAFIGDSPNDEPMFGSFPCSVGVANLKRFLGGLTHRPGFMTTAPGGLGFREFADVLLAARIAT